MIACFSIGHFRVFAIVLWLARYRSHIAVGFTNNHRKLCTYMFLLRLAVHLRTYFVRARCNKLLITRLAREVIIQSRSALPSWIFRREIVNYLCISILSCTWNVFFRALFIPLFRSIFGVGLRRERVKRKWKWCKTWKTFRCYVCLCVHVFGCGPCLTAFFPVYAMCEFKSSISSLCQLNGCVPL